MVRAKTRRKDAAARRHAMALVLTGTLSMFAARCGGESITRPSGSSGDGPQTGGSGGRGAGATGGVGAVGTGGTGMGATGGFGVTGGTGGSSQGGFTMGGMAPVGGAPQAGMPSNPFAHCMAPPLIAGTTCSFEQTCEVLECGAPWSLQDAKGCLRRPCSADVDCADTERCVPAPVAGDFADWLTAGCESCEVTGGQCQCSCLEGSDGLRAVCLARSEFPPSRDCPIDGLSCAGLALAADVVSKYLNTEDFLEAQEVLQSCSDKIREEQFVACGVGQGGAGGEGGSG